MKKIAIASDHRGFFLKEKVKEYLDNLNYKYKDFGVYNSEVKVDYPDYVKIVCREIKHNNFNYGILICRTGIGMSISANKIKGIRAALCMNKEMAQLARLDNDANVLVLSAEFTPILELEDIIKNFLEIDEPLGDRHKIRRDKIKQIEEEKE